MTLEDIGGSKTKLAIWGTILSVAVSLVTYTVTMTMLYANVTSDLRNLNTLMIEKQAQSDREHDVFRFDIRELRRAVQASRRSEP